jgi:hypothetical protein
MTPSEQAYARNLGRGPQCCSLRFRAIRSVARRRRFARRDASGSHQVVVRSLSGRCLAGLVSWVACV